MEVEKLLKEQEEKINGLEKMLHKLECLSLVLEVELVEIINAVDDKDKKIFSNDKLREDELKKRCAKQYNEKVQLKIDIEIQRLRIGLLTERIKFYSK